MANDLYLEIRSENWHTIDYPLKKEGTAEIAKVRYNSGYYLMEGVDGFAFFELESPLMVTVLRINGTDVMVDDPLHWIGMQRLAEHCKGRVIIAGLGLGLILHHLADNKDVDEIVVVENNMDVINMISPMLRPDPRVSIINEDIRAFELCELAKFDTIVFDVWVKGDKGMDIEYPGFQEIMVRAGALKDMFHKNVMVWGMRNGYNPAVKMTKEVEKILMTVTKKE